MDLPTLRRAMAPTSVSDTTLAMYLPHFLEAMRAAEITTVRRAAAWCSQVGHESAGLRYMAEIKTSDPTWNWDRTRYRGRGPIQLTWQGNYRKFGQWCQGKGYVNDPELFVNQPELVEQPKWGFLAASWYWLNAGPKPGQINGFADAGDIYSVSRCVNGWRVDAAGNAVDPNGWNDNDGSRLPRWNSCLAIGDALLTGDTPVAENRPDFNEFWIQTKNASSRGGTQVDAFFIHTQEGGGGDAAAEDLGNYCRSTEGTANPVSYHYYISQASDGGVTVVDGVDTDLYSYSVLSANRRSINLCFAGSRASWTRDQWMKQSKAIDVAAYLAVQDAKKYGFSTKVIAPPYTGRIPGISDHRYVTKVLGDGTHTDVGDQFPWDYFAERVAFWADGGNSPEIPDSSPKQFPKDYSDRELLESMAVDAREIRAQLGAGLDEWGEDGDLGRNDQGQRRTLRAGLAAALRKLGAL
ncbi:glycoside hydrolase family 19 protein [Mycolicibacterium fortuitum]|uniref:glycoside hydrolase family 19 protein n=1 Tax=Mycolicibacterium fortuitum TaxID=1766 RepID=UPI0009D6DE5A|nr:glycoside hydrolase family 19 protein [Mycolicibacterium fortuitum]